jgi:4-hydroxy-2-oxoheptanedioate aldolase
MSVPRNALKAALLAGRPQFGLWAGLASNYAVEIVAGAGFDWIVLETEHAPNDLESVLSQLQAAAAYPSCAAAVRVPWNDMVTIKRYLDIGAQTLVVPFVQNETEALAAVAATRYPPAGVRGVAGTTRATRFGRVKDYAKRAHEELCLVLQIENQAGLDNIERIAAVEGVDVVFLGPADIHASLGYLGETANPTVLPKIDTAIARIKAAGKIPGILAGTEETARRWIGMGALFVGVGQDVGILARGAEQLAAKFQSVKA